MKNPAVWSIVVAIALLLSGCLSPTGSAQKAITKTARLKAQVQETESRVADKGRAYVHGVGVALQKAPNGDAAVDVARGLTRNAGVALGPPSAADAATIERVVAGSLSGVPSEEKSAAARLAGFNGEVAKLQATLATDQKKEGSSEVAKDALLLSNSSLAQTWVSLKRWVFGGVALLLFLLFLPLIVRVVALASPALGPLLGLLTAPLAHMVRSAVEHVPNVGARAGVVAKAAFDRTEQAASNAIGALEDLKADRDAREKVKAVLKARGGSVDLETETLRIRRVSSTRGSTPSG